MTAEELTKKCKAGLKTAGLYDTNVGKRVYRDALLALLVELEADYEAVSEEIEKEETACQE